MYDTILYPTDGSPAAEAAIDHIKNQAQQHDATIHVLYVIDPEHAGAGMGADPASGSDEGMVVTPAGGASGMVSDRSVGDVADDDVEAEALDLVESAAAEFDGIETQAAVCVGTPTDVILKYADEAGADLIAMSTHGRSGLDRYLIGSVAEKVVRFADAPVLTVRAEQ
jgi:nucleotide-binding universal stress UspA family protein